MQDDPRDFKSAKDEFEQAIRKKPMYVLRLFISGMTPRSVQAIENLKKICKEHLQGAYELEVIDIYQQPELGRKEQIIAVPTLIKKLPAPLRKFIGDLSNTEKILIGLNIDPHEED